MSKALLTTFDVLYQQKTGARYPVNGGKDGKLLKDLRAIYSDEDIERYMRAFFEIDDDFIEQSGYGLGVFRGCLPKVIAFASKKQKPDLRGHVPPCRTNTECLKRVLAS